MIRPLVCLACTLLVGLMTSGIAAADSLEGVPLPMTPLHFYVAPDGNDAGPCTSPMTACRTVQAAIDRIPLVLAAEVTVHLNGDLEGDAHLADRLCPGSDGVRFLGEGPDGASLAGFITVSDMARVSLENLRVVGGGLACSETHCVLDRCHFFDSAGDAIFASHASLAIRNSVIVNTSSDGPMRHGLSCDYSEIALDGVEVSRARNFGLNARQSCRVTLGGPLVVRDNGQWGCAAGPGSLIQFANRSDVEVAGNFPGRVPPIPMYAYYQGNIVGYQNVVFDVADDIRCWGDLEGLCWPY